MYTLYALLTAGIIAMTISSIYSTIYVNRHYSKLMAIAGVLLLFAFAI
jgi:hypothetical protein